jgi:hypothetical protein
MMGCERNKMRVKIFWPEDYRRIVTMLFQILP